MVVSPIGPYLYAIAAHTGACAMLGNIALSCLSCCAAVYICTVRTELMGDTVFKAGFAIGSVLHMLASPRV